jgi:hypothetical protein
MSRKINGTKSVIETAVEKRSNDSLIRTVAKNCRDKNKPWNEYQWFFYFEVVFRELEDKIWGYDFNKKVIKTPNEKREARKKVTGHRFEHLLYNHQENDPNSNMLSSGQWFDREISPNQKQKENWRFKTDLRIYKTVSMVGNQYFFFVYDSRSEEKWRCDLNSVKIGKNISVYVTPKRDKKASVFKAYGVPYKNSALCNKTEDAIFTYLKVVNGEIKDREQLGYTGDIIDSIMNETNVYTSQKDKKDNVKRQTTKKRKVKV